MQLTSMSKPEPGGGIIATGSVAGIRSNAGSTDYSASKAAVGSLVQTCAWQLAGTGVRINAVLPGLVETGMTRSVYERARERGTEGGVGGLNPLRRGGVADEVARVVLFLGSEEARWVLFLSLVRRNRYNEGKLLTQPPQQLRQRPRLGRRWRTERWSSGRAWEVGVDVGYQTDLNLRCRPSSPIRWVVEGKCIVRIRFEEVVCKRGGGRGRSGRGRRVCREG